LLIGVIASIILIINYSFPKIKDAIEHEIKSKVYRDQNLAVNKTQVLIGEDRNLTIVIIFNNEINESSITNNTFSLISNAAYTISNDTNSIIYGKVDPEYYKVFFIPQDRNRDVDYNLSISSTIKDINGNNLVGGYNKPIIKKVVDLPTNAKNTSCSANTGILKGTPEDDELYGNGSGCPIENNVQNNSNLNDKIYGLEGNDRIYGGDGKDTIVGGPGGDYLSGRNDDDVIYTGSNTTEVMNDTSKDIVFAGGGNDHIYPDGMDIIDCGSGYDTVYKPKNVQITITNCEIY
jgi:Ca2+-binding RTX toxin-like protein